jgi:hypothetical protein
VSAYRQIELFCQSEGQECNPDIATYLGDVAFQAVEKVLRVSEGAMKIIISLIRDQRKNHHRFSISTFLHSNIWTQGVKRSMWDTVNFRS